jgi:hypothetical protein
VGVTHWGTGNPRITTQTGSCTQRIARVRVRGVPVCLNVASSPPDVGRHLVCRGTAGQSQKSSIFGPASFHDEHFSKVITQGQQQRVVRRGLRRLTSQPEQGGTTFAMVNEHLRVPRLRHLKSPTCGSHQLVRQRGYSGDNLFNVVVRVVPWPPAAATAEHHRSSWVVAGFLLGLDLLVRPCLELRRTVQVGIHAPKLVFRRRGVSSARKSPSLLVSRRRPELIVRDRA